MKKHRLVILLNDFGRVFDPIGWWESITVGINSVQFSSTPRQHWRSVKKYHCRYQFHSIFVNTMTGFDTHTHLQNETKLTQTTKSITYSWPTSVMDSTRKQARGFLARAAVAKGSNHCSCSKDGAWKGWDSAAREWRMAAWRCSLRRRATAQAQLLNCCSLEPAALP